MTILNESKKSSKRIKQILPEDVIGAYKDYEKIATDRGVYDALSAVTLTARDYLTPLDKNFEDGQYEDYWFFFIKIGHRTISELSIPPNINSVKQINKSLYAFIGSIVMMVNDYTEQGPRLSNPVST